MIKTFKRSATNVNLDYSNNLKVPRKRGKLLYC